MHGLSFACNFFFRNTFIASSFVAMWISYVVCVCNHCKSQFFFLCLHKFKILKCCFTRKTVKNQSQVFCRWFWPMFFCSHLDNAFVSYLIYELWDAMLNKNNSANKNVNINPIFQKYSNDCHWCQKLLILVETNFGENISTTKKFFFSWERLSRTFGETKWRMYAQSIEAKYIPLNSTNFLFQLREKERGKTHFFQSALDENWNIQMKMDVQFKRAFSEFPF